jgi:hypothetical protein
MKYAKPQVVRSGDAVRTIHGHNKTAEPTTDSMNPPDFYVFTVSAYEADE